MNAKVLLVCGVLAASLAQAACAPAAGQAPVTVPCDAFQSQKAVSREVSVPAGGAFEVSLCANPSTGYAWGEATIADPSIVQQVERHFVGPATPLPGAPGNEVWTFKGLRAGTTAVSMGYARAGESAEWSFTLTVTVK